MIDENVDIVWYPLSYVPMLYFSISATARMGFTVMQSLRMSFNIDSLLIVVYGRNSELILNNSIKTREKVNSDKKNNFFVFSNRNLRLFTVHIG